MADFSKSLVLIHSSIEIILMQPIICCVRAQSAREFVTEISGGRHAAPHRAGSGRWRVRSELKP